MEKTYNKYIDRLIGYIKQTNRNEVTKVCKVLIEAIKEGKRIYVAGNGGSMATAIHFSEDLMLGNDLGVKSFHFGNISKVTAISNDEEYSQVFSYQLRKVMDNGDIFFCISASGNSRNLIEGIKVANQKGISIGLSGFNGGGLKRHSTYSIHTKTKVGDYEATEDLHYIICHMIACMIRGD